MLFLLSIPGTYFNALLVCFFVVSFREHGIILNPLKVVQIFWPVLKALLFGFLPAVLVASIIQQLFPNLSTWYHLAIPILGIFVGAVLLHTYLLAKFNNRSLFHISVAVLLALQVGLFAALFFQIPTPVV